MNADPVLAVVRLSESFTTLWADLASESRARLALVPPGESPPDAAGVLLAAGGEEAAAPDVVAGLAPNGVPVWVVGGDPSHRFAVEALRAGAADYFCLPDDLDRLRRTIAARIDAVRERHRRSGERAAGGGAFAALVGESPALRETIDKARRVLPHGDVTVLIGGETGTGKELLARALHDGGPRAAGPFVAVNCAAIPAQLLESELFGHERGAFTDAHRSKPGLFEEADSGTLFLDEVGHLPLPLQGKLLRALEDRQIRRVGGNQSRTVDVRIIAASHVALDRAVERGEFREDLYYRLNVVALVLPPLRDRGDDVALLAETFTRDLARRYQLPEPKLTAPVKSALSGHAWPGNVRELRHAIERALLLSAPGTLDPAQLVPGARADAAGAAVLPFPATLDEIERAAAHAALDRYDGNKSAAARQLGISRSRLQRLLDEAGDAAQ